MELSEKKVKAIKQGALIEGMSKQAVLCCYGLHLSMPLSAWTIIYGYIE